MTAFQSISSIQRTIVSIFYALLCASIVYPLWILLSFLEIPIILQLLLTFVIIIIFVIFGAFFFLVVSLPEKLSRNFDKIRNGIAEGSINTPEKFATELNSFLIRHFNYLFLDIEYSALAVVSKNEIFYCDDFPDSIKPRDLNNLLKESAETEELVYKGLNYLNNEKLHCFMLPVHFGERHLGYILIYTTNKITRLFKAVLADFENYYVDDQLLHVINFEESEKAK